MPPDDPRSDEDTRLVDAPDPDQATVVVSDGADAEAETVATPRIASEPRPDAGPAPDPEEATIVERAGVDEQAPTVATPGTAPRVRSARIDTQAATVLDASDPRAELRTPELVEGTVLFGEYVVEKRIGAGGMGEVYRARHRRLGELRAIKVVRHQLGGQDAASRLFDREARSLLKISHPAVVRCHDLLSDDDGRVYLVMEFVEGVSLWDRIRARPLEAAELRALADRLAAGLSAAHAEGVVHRDLSPDNVVLPEGDPSRAKLIDFGIAKELERSETTILEGFKGKLMYASPEQLGFYDGIVGPSSDYYSLGLLLACAAGGKSLDMGGSLIKAVEARRSLPELPKQLPDDLRRAVRRLLAQDPAKRPGSLDLLRQGGAAAEKRSGRPPWLAAAGATAVAAIAAVVWLGQRGAVEPAPTPEPVTPTAETTPAVPSLPVTEAPAPAPPPAPAVAAVTEPVAEPEPPKPAVQKPRRPTAAERAAALRRELQVEGLLAGARAAVEEDRLSSPAGDNAVEKYRAVLDLDPGNREARSGLEGVGARYIDLAEAALGRGETEQAARFAKLAAGLAPKHPRLAATRAAVAEAQAGQ